MTSTGGGSRCDHDLLHLGPDGAVPLVHHVGDRDAGGGGPVDGLEVVVHRVLHRTHRIGDERQRGVIERVAAVGAPERLGVGGRGSVIDRPSFSAAATAMRRPSRCRSCMHVDAALALGRHQCRVEDDRPDPAPEGGDNARHDQARPRNAPPA